MQFKFPKTVVNQSEIPDKFRGLYEDDGSGTWQLIDDPRISATLEAVRGAFGALDSERADHNATRNSAVDLSPLTDFGSTPAEIAVKIKEMQEAATAATKDGVSIEDAITSAREAWQREHLAASQKQDGLVDALKAQLTKSLVDEQVESLVDELNPTPAGRKMFKLLIKEGARPQLNDANELVVTVVDGDGKLRYSGSDARADGSMTLKEFAAEVGANKDNQAYIASDAPTGGGAPPITRMGPQQRPAAEKSSLQKIRDGLAAGAHRET